MVSIWPWKVDDTSPASFEKTLSTLSTRITKATARLDNLRQRSRRFNVLWTLYSIFAYLLYSIVSAFVRGWRNWGLIEIGAVLGGPPLIYAVRLGLVSYYNYRTSKLQAQLDELQRQRDTTIEKLKAATKYNTTQELLKKYGGSPNPKLKSLSSSERRSASRDRNSGTSGVGRTSFIPPPTANIPEKTGPIPLPNTPQRSSPQSKSPLGQSPPFSADSTLAPLQQYSSPHGSAEFAPNAFPTAPEYAQSREGSRWYDRLMDVLLGEDESLPRNRLALICKKCRLVNGQAPPGAKRPEDVGKWRCGECGTVNGEETEATKIIATIKEEVKAKTESPTIATGVQAESGDEMGSGHALGEIDDGEESDITQYSESSTHGDEVSQPKALEAEPTKELETLRRRAGRPKGSKNKKT